MLKVLYIDQPIDPPGGGQISLFVLLKNLKTKIDFEVFMPYYCRFLEQLKEENIKVRIVPIFNLYFEIKKLHPDIIHCNSATTKYTFLAGFIAKMLKINFVWHNRVIEKSFLKDSLIAMFSDKIIVTSDVIRYKFKNFQKKVIKIYNPVDIKEFKPGLPIDYLYKELNVSSKDKIIGIFSRLDWWKGHKIAIEAFDRLCKKLKNVKLIIVGDGPYKEEIINFTKNFSSYDNIIFLGFRKDIPQLMNMCDIILNPSTEPEPFGRTIIEAMACGKVVIATDFGGPKELIINFVDGILVKPCIEELKNSMELLLTDKKLYEKISKNAQEKAKKFSIENYVDHILQIYKELSQKE
ncbi:MAG: glycosyltransferase family 4 protein [Elusimicrobiota bacterium]|nr:glycosyltransferase family 4 protein [Endomicrobiia bacterium]MDW8165358.1 glycosyltransferase family 4 protein [Elusimicrobiota bacterium]